MSDDGNRAAEPKWRVRMPKGRPPKGKAQMVLAVKFSTGARAEHVLIVSSEFASKLMHDSIYYKPDLPDAAAVQDEASTTTKPDLSAKEM